MATSSNKQEVQARLCLPPAAGAVCHTGLPVPCQPVAMVELLFR